MNVDIPTLMAAAALATAAAGLLTAMASFADREAEALPWWAAAYLLLAASIAGLAAGNTDTLAPTTILSSLLLSGSPGLMWTGTRVFCGRRPMVAAIAIGPLVYAVTVALQSVCRAPQLTIAVSLCAASAYLALAVAELSRQRTEELKARWPLIAFLSLHAIVLVVGGLDAGLAPFPATRRIDADLIFSILDFEQLVFVMASAIFMIVMVRERSELRHKTAAGIDTLTGLATRRAFLDLSERLLLDTLSRDAALALVICDLDHFKVINDTHGHATGDLVLQMFAHIARSRLRLGDVMGRLGGEEFAIVMPGAGWEVAHSVAERIRLAFAEGRVQARGEVISTTVSAGIATAHHSSTVGRLLAEADAALYRAKALGRNRIAIADRGRKSAEPSSLVRVA